MTRTIQFASTLATLAVMMAAYSATSAVRPMSEAELTNSTGGSNAAAKCFYGIRMTLACYEEYTCNIATPPKCDTSGVAACSSTCNGTPDMDFVNGNGQTSWKSDKVVDCGKQYMNDPACQKKTNPAGKDYCGCATGGQASNTNCGARVTMVNGCGASATPKTTTPSPTE